MSAVDSTQDRVLRILITIHYPLNYNSGAAGLLIRLADALRGLGHEVEMFGFDQMTGRTGRKVDELTFPIQASRVIRRKLLNGSVDAVDASTGDLWPLSSTLLRGARGVAVTRTHGLEHLETLATREASERGEVDLRRRYNYYYGGLRLNLVARSLRIADGVFVANAYERDWVAQHLNLDPGRVHQVRNGVADHFLKASERVDATSRRPSVAVIGPFVWRKGAGTAATVLSSLLTANPDMRAGWFGAPREDVLSNLDPGTHRRVEVVPRYDLQDLPELLSRYQVLLVMSRFEGLPGVILEGMASGLAVVASDIPGCRDLLAGSGAGVLVPPGDPSTAVDRIEELLSKPEQLYAMQQAGLRYARTSSWTEVASETARLYRSLIDEKAASRVRRSRSPRSRS